MKSARQPITNVQSEELPAVQNNPPGNPNAAVMPKTKAIPNVQNIQAKYKNFKAQPKPAVVPSARFNQNYQIAGAQNWSGPQYQAFASYRPQWHDQGWWSSREQHYTAIAGQAARVTLRVNEILGAVPKRPSAQIYRIRA